MLRQIPTQPLGAKNFPFWSYSWVCFHSAPGTFVISAQPISSSSWHGRSVQAHSHMDTYVQLSAPLNMPLLPLNLWLAFQEQIEILLPSADRFVAMCHLLWL